MIDFFKSTHGREYPLLYLWLVKDFTWCALHFYHVGMASGSLSLVYTVALVIVNLRERQYREGWKAGCLLLWLSANYSWMVGEFFVQNLGYNETFYDKSQHICQITSLFAVTANVVYFSMILPFKLLPNKAPDDHHFQVLGAAPRTPSFLSVKDFRDYEGIHVFFWSVKDCSWSFENKIVFIPALLFTVLINLDILCRYKKTPNNTFHAVNFGVLLIWVTANGIWAIGELFVENEHELSKADLDAFKFPFPPTNKILIMRYLACWVFAFAGLCACVCVGGIYVWSVKDRRRRGNNHPNKKVQEEPPLIDNFAEDNFRYGLLSEVNDLVSIEDTNMRMMTLHIYTLHV